MDLGDGATQLMAAVMRFTVTSSIHQNSDNRNRYIGPDDRDDLTGMETLSLALLT